MVGMCGQLLHIVYYSTSLYVFITELYRTLKAHVNKIYDARRVGNRVGPWHKCVVGSYDYWVRPCGNHVFAFSVIYTCFSVL